MFVVVIARIGHDVVVVRRVRSTDVNEEANGTAGTTTERIMRVCSERYARVRNQECRAIRGNGISNALITIYKAFY